MYMTYKRNSYVPWIPLRLEEKLYVSQDVDYVQSHGLDVSLMQKLSRSNIADLWHYKQHVPNKWSQKTKEGIVDIVGIRNSGHCQ